MIADIGTQLFLEQVIILLSSKRVTLLEEEKSTGAEIEASLRELAL